jgi:DNA polymerase III psi subunit
VGVVHKLKPEIIKFIIDNKQANPHLSCRSLVVLLLEKFQVEVSKSSINAIFKENNLSLPVGRRQKLKKKKFNLPALPVIENIKTVMVVEQAQKPVLKNEPEIPEKPKDKEVVIEKPKIEVVQEQPKEQPVEKINLEEKRIQEAESWAKKLLEEETIRLEQARLAQEKAKKKAEEDRLAKEETERKSETEKLLREKAEVELKEKEAQLKAEEEKLAKEATQKKAEEDRLIKEETERKSETEKLLREKAEAELKEKKAQQKNEEEKEKEDQEALAREAELNAERQRWARLAEEENKRKEAVAAAKVIKEEAKVESRSEPTLPKECTGVVLLKAVDYLIRGSVQLSEAMQRRLGYPKEEVEALTQTLIFQNIVGNEPGALSSVVRNEIGANKLSGYFTQLQELKTMQLDLSRLIASIFTESRGLKMHFIDGSVVYLDAQMHTLWSTPHMPQDFSATVASIKNCVDRYFFRDGNLVLFMAPGYDVPAKEFFKLLLNFNSPHEAADNLILYGNKLDELESIALNPGEEHNLLFALWPWQFTAYRKVKRIGEFSLEHVDCLDKDFYLAQIEIDLMQPANMQPLSLKGCAIKLSLAEKIRVVVLSTNASKSLFSLANDYLSRWPNLDEGFHDFNRKIELFNCTQESKQFFAYEDLPINQSEPVDLKSVFSGYCETLDTYLKWHFMPSGYEKQELKITKERFYSLKGQLTQSQDKLHYFFTVTRDYAYAKDLEYICRRLNERDIRTDDGTRICFESGFK